MWQGQKPDVRVLQSGKDQKEGKRILPDWTKLEAIKGEPTGAVSKLDKMGVWIWMCLFGFKSEPNGKPLCELLLRYQVALQLFHVGRR